MNAVAEDVRRDARLGAEEKRGEPVDVCLRLAKAKHPKYAVRIAGCLKELVARDADPAGTRIGPLVDALAAIASISADCELRVLQVLPLLQTDRLQGQVLHDALSIAIPYCARSPIATASLQQLLVVLLDSERDDVAVVADDLFAAIAGREGQFIDFTALKPLAVLELVEGVLDCALVRDHIDVPVLTATYETTRDLDVAQRLARIIAKLLGKHDSLLRSWLALLEDTSDIKHDMILEALSRSMAAIGEPEEVLQAMSRYEASLPGLGSWSYPGADETLVSPDGLDVLSQKSSTGIGDAARPSRPLLSGTPHDSTPLYRYVLVFEIVVKAAERPAKGLLLLLSALLSSSLTLPFERRLLAAYKTATHKLDDVQRNQYLKRIGRSAVATALEGRSGPTGRSLACLECFLELVTELRDRLDKAAWSIVFAILSSADAVLRGSALNLMAVAEDRSDTPARAARLREQIWHALEADSLSDAQFLDFLDALCSAEPTTPMSPGAASTSANPDFRARALQVVLKAQLSRFARQVDARTIVSETLPGQQELLRHFILDLVQTQLEQRDQVLMMLQSLYAGRSRTTATVIETIGHDLTEREWAIVLDAVVDTDDVRGTYGCLQLILNDFVSTMPDFAFARLTAMCSALVRQADLNVALGSTTLLQTLLESAAARNVDGAFWDVYSDELMRNCKESSGDVRDASIRSLFVSLESLDNARTRSLTELIGRELLQPGLPPSTAKLLLSSCGAAVGAGELLDRFLSFLATELLSLDSTVVLAGLEQVKQLTRKGHAEALWSGCNAAFRRMLSEEHAALQKLGQQAVSKLVDCLTAMPSEERFELVADAVTYSKSDDYLLDREHLSEVQRAALPVLQQAPDAIVSNLICCCVEHSGHYTEVRQRAGWNGEPTYIAIVGKLLRVDRPSIARIVAHRYGPWRRAVTMTVEDDDVPFDLAVDVMTSLCESKPGNDEEFTLQALNRLQARVLPEIARHDRVCEYVTSLEHGSRFALEAPYPDQILREWCWLELLQMSSDTTFPLALEATRRRARDIFDRFGAVSGHAPMAEHDLHELRTLLHHLADPNADARPIVRDVYEDCVRGLVRCVGESASNTSVSSKALADDLETVLLAAHRYL